MEPVVDGPDEITPAWLTATLQSQGHHLTVTSVEPERIGTGQMGSTFRLGLTYDGPPGPSTLVAKLGAGDPETRAVISFGYRAEVSFYADLLPGLDVRTPRCWYGAIVEDGTCFTLLLDDVPEARPGVQADGCTAAQARAAIANLVGLHAPRWNDPALRDSPFLMQPDAGMAELMGQATVSATEAFVDRYHDQLDDRTATTLCEVAPRITAWQQARLEPFSVIHGDYRLDNLLFSPSDEVVALDWQSAAVGPPLRDVAYFLGTCVETEQRRATEEQLVTEYHAGLVAQGIDDYDLDRCWDDYRVGQLQGPMITTIGCIYASGERTERSDGMFLAMATRSCAAIQDLQSLALLGSTPMGGPLEGFKVVELGMWVAGPAAAGILGDWGAEVVKIEPPTGDPFRGLLSAMGLEGTNPPFELDNRGKRSVSLNLSTDDGKALAAELIDQADVFVTNVRPGALARAGLDHATLSARNPRLVYAHVSGYGIASDDADRAAYDVGAFWSRAGVAAALTPDGQELPYQRGGMGDHMAGMAAAGAVSAALLARERTGEGQLVSVSLLRIGMYMLGWDVQMALRMGVPTVPMVVHAPPNPLITAYTAGDGKRFWMLGLQGDRHWPDVVRAVDRPEWAEDPRYVDILARFSNSAELVTELNTIFATKPLSEWGEIFDREDVWWAPVQHAHDTVEDPLCHAAGGFVDVPIQDADPVTMVASPADFFGTPWKPRSGPPEHGQHTEEILLELGYDWDRIIELKDAGAIP